MRGKSEEARGKSKEPAGADAETVALSASRESIALIERSRARQATEGGVSLEKIKAEFGIV